MVLNLRFNLAKLVGVSLSLLLRRLPFSGGGAAPGLLALAIDPNFLKKYRQAFSGQIIVSGTNGKTTTTRMISSILTAQHLAFIHNRFGSNLLRGVASTLLACNKKFKPKPFGLWEVDEAVLPHAIAQLQPNMVVITNLFRDQLDRYGEIDTLAAAWKKTLNQLPESSTLILNGDDAGLIALSGKVKAKLKFFGINDPKIGETLPAHAADATFCPQCLKPLHYQQVFYSHLGNFSCGCGFTQPAKEIVAQSLRISPHTLNYKAKIGSQLITVKLPLTGLFNVYNSLAAITVSYNLGFNFKTTQGALSRFQPAFGKD